MRYYIDLKGTPFPIEVSKSVYYSRRRANSDKYFVRLNVSCGRKVSRVLVEK